MKKIVFILCFILLFLTSCASTPSLRIREYKSNDGFIAVADEHGSGVEITTLKNIHFVTINKMVYDYENKEIGFYSKENVMALSSKEPEPVKEYVEVIDTPGPKKVKSEIDYSVYTP